MEERAQLRSLDTLPLTPSRKRGGEPLRAAEAVRAFALAGAPEAFLTGEDGDRGWSVPRRPSLGASMPAWGQGRVGAGCPRVSSFQKGR